MTPPVGSLLVRVPLAEPDQFPYHLVHGLGLETAEREAHHGAHADAGDPLQPSASDHPVKPPSVLGSKGEAVPALGEGLVGVGVFDAWSHALTIARMSSRPHVAAHETIFVRLWYSRVVGRYIEVSR